MSGKMAASVMMAAAGVLCLVVPVPGAQIFGGFLITTAAANAASELIEKGDKNEKDIAEGNVNENTKRILEQYGVKH